MKRRLFVFPIIGDEYPAESWWMETEVGQPYHLNGYTGVVTEKWIFFGSRCEIRLDKTRLYPQNR